MNSSDSPQSAWSSPDDAGANHQTSSLSSLKDSAKETFEEAKQSASQTFDAAKERAAEIASQRKKSFADQIGSYGDAINKSADSLQEQDPNIAWLTHRVADRLSGAANYVRTRDFGQLKEDAEDLATRHPLAFFGGLFVAGIVVGNLLKASGRAVVQRPAREASYPRAEHVPAADVPGTDPWPSEPEAATMT